ncbi:hypothetical protein [Streptomyces niveus]|uniref:hypothetical protein n=1 Tax=Streptomyces niveus TaxID=193462 RepID=UPI0036D2101B
MGPNQRFKNELDTLIDQQLLPEDREAGRTNRPGPADTPQPSLPKQQNGAYD